MFHDEPDHSLISVKWEGAQLEFTPRVAGEFISRRSVNFHDHIGGSGSMLGYAITKFQHGPVYSRCEGQREGSPKNTKGSWKTCKETGIRRIVVIDSLSPARIDVA